MSISQVCGTYTVLGYNPEKHNYSYFGELQIKEKEKVLLGAWKIGQMEYDGIGLLIGNILAFHFKYLDSTKSAHTGIVLYEIISDDVMRGYWTGFGTFSIGFEECRKKKPDE